MQVEKTNSKLAFGYNSHYGLNLRSAIFKGEVSPKVEEELAELRRQLNSKTPYDRNMYIDFRKKSGIFEWIIKPFEQNTLFAQSVPGFNKTQEGLLRNQLPARAVETKAEILSNIMNTEHVA